VNLLVGVPESQHVRRGHQEALAMGAFLRDHGWLEDPTGYHLDPPPLRRPTLEVKSTRGLGGRHDYQELSFESEYEPHPGEPGRERWLALENNGTAVAYVLEHSDRDRPWLVATHGFSMGAPTVNIQGLAAQWMHETLGLNVLMPVLPLHGPRSDTRFSGGELLQPDFANVLHLFSQAVWDIRRMVDWIRQRSEQKVGLYGISLGGYTVALTSAFIDDLGCVISGIPAVDFTSLARVNEPWVLRAYSAELQTDWELIRYVIHPASPLNFQPRVPLDKRFIFAGAADRIARPDQARALWRHWGKPEIEWLSSGHVLASMKDDLKPWVGRVVARNLFEEGEAPFEWEPDSDSELRASDARGV